MLLVKFADGTLWCRMNDLSLVSAVRVHLPVGASRLIIPT